MDSKTLLEDLLAKWQAEEQRGFPEGYAEVRTFLEKQGHPELAIKRFFLSGNLRLGGETPLESLRSGGGDVMRAARAFGEHGAA